MNITVNGSPVTLQDIESRNLEEILLNLASTELPQNHLVGVVRLNGTEFSESYPRQSRDIDTEGLSQLDITTVPFETYIDAAIKDCALLLDRIVLAANKTAEIFRISDESDANDHFARLIESLRDLFRFIAQVQKVADWDFSTIEQNGASVQQDWERMQELVEELKNTQEECDWILLADLIEYELVPLLTRWMQVFQKQSVSCEAADTV